MLFSVSKKASGRCREAGSASPLPANRLPDPYNGMLPCFFGGRRITSYNVCYTKLLRVLSLRLERDEAQRQVGEARSKAFRFLRLYLFMLKEELQRRRHDAIRMVTVEVAIETNLATLEALGWQEQAQKAAREILGPELYAAYFDGATRNNFV